MDPAAVAEHLAARGRWTYSRPSGPGGQRRDHVETRAALVIEARDLADLPAPIAARLIERLGLAERPLRLRSQRERSRELNRQAVIARLTDRVRTALAPPAPARRATRPGAAAVRRAQAAKERQSALKRARAIRPGEDD